MSLRHQLETPRLILRVVGDNDVVALCDLRTQPQVREFLGGPLTELGALRKARDAVGLAGHYVVIKRAGEKVIGLVSLTTRGLEIELSYEFFPEVWGRGLALESCSALLAATVADGDARHVVAVTQVRNLRSRRLLASLGMTLREEFVEHGQPQALYEVERRSS